MDKSESNININKPELTKPELNKQELNICRVLSESQIDKIIQSKTETITLVMFCYDIPQLRIFMKRYLAKLYPSYYFVMAILNKQDSNTDNFIRDRQTYIKQIQSLPYVFFFYDAKPIAQINDAEPSIIIDTLCKLTELLKNNTNNNTNNENTTQNQLHGMAREYQLEKINEDKKLHELNVLHHISNLTNHDNEDNEDEDNEDNEDNEVNEVNLSEQDNDDN
jgi:hypothetical protein